MIRRPDQTNYSANDEDISFITRFRNGDKTAFDGLMVKYQDSIMNLCVRILGNYSDGEDAAQETFVKVYKNLDTFKGEALFSTWLYRIAVNTCRNKQRSWWHRVSQRAVKLDAPVQTEENERAREISDTSLSPEKDLTRHRIADTVKEALSTLPKKHRELIVLRDIQGCRYEEIGKILGISLGTVKSRLVRARSAMQEKLKGKINGF